LGFIIKPSFTAQNEWKVSFRSSKDYQEVATMAEALGGGGHQYASAAVVSAEEETRL
jgi:nanoRNase/pAp phosphatase (c-di-AMP/oligoRNAs hydrolase)